MIEVRTQAELDAACEQRDPEVHIAALGRFNVIKTIGWLRLTMVAAECSVVARDSAHVEARDSAHVVARGHVMLRLFSALKITASAQVIIAKHGTAKELIGGHVIEMPAPTTAQEWCDHYGVTVTDGVALLYKGVDDAYDSPNGFNYTPGTVPVAPDWDGGREECGGGLHFSPHPVMTLEFASEATKFLACPVALPDIAVHPKGQYPQKVKAKGCCGPVVECDRNGKIIDPAKVAA